MSKGILFTDAFTKLYFKLSYPNCFVQRILFFISFLLLKLTRSVSLIPTLDNLSQRKKLSKKHMGELLKVA